jgi:predicted S18 family serine protease
MQFTNRRFVNAFRRIRLEEKIAVWFQRGESMKKQVLFVLLALAFVLAVFPSAVSAQAVTGTILGTVTDSKGGAIANVTITVTNSDQNVVVRTVTTDESGQFTVPLLPVGR